MKRIAIIGGGSAGLFLASVYKNNMSDIIVFERNSRLGKKLLTTGNGRCNLSNENVAPEKYNSPEFVKSTLDRLPPEKLKSIYKSMGLITKTDSEGRIYPLCDSAATVLDLLLIRLRQNNVSIRTDCEITEVIPNGNEYILVDSNSNRYTFDVVIVACGGKTNILGNTKHRLKSFTPILCPIKTELSYFKKLSGIRISARVSVYKKDKRIFTENGEVLFRDYGISGIVVFNASRYISNNTIIELDILPQLSEVELVDLLYKRKKQFAFDKSFNILNGIFQGRLADEIYKYSKSRSPEELVNIIKHTRVKVLGVGDERQAQVTRGGYDTSQVDPLTMESSLHKNLFIIGEALDIDGECGGYNLHWAFASAYTALSKIES